MARWRRRSPPVVDTRDGSTVAGVVLVEGTRAKCADEVTYHAAGVYSRLLFEQIHGALNVEAEEITRLSSSVNFGLPYILALADHGSGHEGMSILARHEGSRPHKDGRTVFEWRVFPCRLRLQGTFYCILHIGRSARNIVGHDLLVVCRIHLLDGFGASTLQYGSV